MQGKSRQPSKFQSEYGTVPYIMSYTSGPRARENWVFALCSIALLPFVSSLIYLPTYSHLM